MKQCSFWSSGLLLIAGFSQCVLVACNKESSPETSVAAAAANGVAAQPSPLSAASVAAVSAGSAAAADCSGTTSPSSVEQEFYRVELKAVGSYKVAEEGVVELEVTPKKGYHTNDKYPYKFKAEPCAGVKYANLVVREDKMKLEPERGTMTVAFTPEAAGQKTVLGTFSFSVCSEENCLIEKQELSLKIQVQ